MKAEFTSPQRLVEWMEVPYHIISVGVYARQIINQHTRLMQGCATCQTIF